MPSTPVDTNRNGKESKQRVVSLGMLWYRWSLRIFSVSGRYEGRACLFIEFN